MCGDRGRRSHNTSFSPGSGSRFPTRIATSDYSTAPEFLIGWHQPDFAFRPVEMRSVIMVTRLCRLAAPVLLLFCCALVRADDNPRIQVTEQMVAMSDGVKLATD